MTRLINEPNFSSFCRRIEDKTTDSIPDPVLARRVAVPDDRSEGTGRSAAGQPATLDGILRRDCYSCSGMTGALAERVWCSYIEWLVRSIQKRLLSRAGYLDGD
jgi:hypothetical protein